MVNCEEENVEIVEGTYLKNLKGKKNGPIRAICFRSKATDSPYAPQSMSSVYAPRNGSFPDTWQTRQRPSC